MPRKIRKVTRKARRRVTVKRYKKSQRGGNNEEELFKIFIKQILIKNNNMINIYEFFIILKIIIYYFNIKNHEYDELALKLNHSFLQFFKNEYSNFDYVKMGDFINKIIPTGNKFIASGDTVGEDYNNDNINSFIKNFGDINDKSINMEKINKSMKRFAKLLEMLHQCNTEAERYIISYELYVQSINNEGEYFGRCFPILPLILVSDNTYSLDTENNLLEKIEGLLNTKYKMHPYLTGNLSELEKFKDNKTVKSIKEKLEKGGDIDIIDFFNDVCKLLKEFNHVDLFEIKSLLVKFIILLMKNTNNPLINYQQMLIMKLQDLFSITHININFKYNHNEKKINNKFNDLLNSLKSNQNYSYIYTLLYYGDNSVSMLMYLNYNDFNNKDYTSDQNTYHLDNLDNLVNGNKTKLKSNTHTTLFKSDNESIIFTIQPSKWVPTEESEEKEVAPTVQPSSAPARNILKGFSRKVGNAWKNRKFRPFSKLRGLFRRKQHSTTSSSNVSSNSSSQTHSHTSSHSPSRRGSSNSLVSNLSMFNPKSEGNQYNTASTASAPPSEESHYNSNTMPKAVNEYVELEPLLASANLNPPRSGSYISVSENTSSIANFE